MTTSYTSLLGLALPVQGELSGAWGDVVNNSITSLLDSAVAGTTTLSTDADVTLTTTTGAANTSREAVLLCTGARTGIRYITAPAQSKTYTVINATTGGYDVYIRGVGPTAGIAVPAGYAVQVAWNSSDFVQTSVPVTKITGLGANVATFLATPSSANLAAALTDETGTGLAVFATSPTLVTPALGTPSALVGTNITGTAAGLTAGNVTTNANLTGAVTSVGNATSLGSFTSANLAAALTDETGTGSAVFATSPTLVTPLLGTPTSVTLTNATGLPLTTGVTGTLPVANGGTGSSTLTLNNVLLGNGTSALQSVAPSTAGNILTSTGTTWASSVPAPGGITYSKYTSNVTTVDKQGVIADTTAGSFTVTLPATPSTGAQVVVVDGANWAVNNLIIGRNGSTIESIAEDMTVDIGGVAITFIYNGTTWDIYAQLGVVPTTAGSFTTLAASSTVSGAGFTNYFASPPALGSTAANAVSATTLSASSTVSGTGFSNYLASPPAIGGTTPAAGTFTSLNTGQLAGLRNRIINGAMTIDQRNGGAAVTLTTGTGGYAPDRFYINNTTPQSVSIQQVADGPTIAQAGFYIPNCLSVTASTGSTPVAGTFGAIQQYIEGNSVIDLGFGQTGARTITVSFWVKATVTGIYCFNLSNSAANRFYSSEYTISATNTWEKKTITIAGDTTGTWLYNTGRGISCTFVMAVGSTYNGGTNNTWVSTALAFATANQVNALATTSNIFRITGVQVEIGSVATPFEQRPYGMELALCKRYLPAFNSTSTVSSVPGTGYATAATATNYTYTFDVEARVPPTGVSVSNVAHFTTQSGTPGNLVCNTLPFVYASRNACTIQPGVASGLTIGQAILLFANNASGQILFTGCEL